MKAILLTLVVGGLAGYALHLKLQLGTAVLDRDSLAAQVADLREQSDKLAADLRDRDAALAAEKAKVKAAADPAPAATAQAPRTTHAAPSPAPVSVAPVTPAPDPQPDARKIRRLAEIESLRAALLAEQARGQSARAAATPPTFAEQGDRVDGFGNVIGKKGIRTSDADRAKVMDAYNARIAAMDARLAEIAAELQTLEAEAASLR